jgi:fructose-1,6-bisphosphatase/inositol monophosphatase family enzyme
MMVTELDYRGLNLSKVTSIIMQNLVRQAIRHIRLGRFNFEVYEKMGVGGSIDVVTNVDKSAQQLYTDMLCAIFPEYGIIAEENNFRVKSTHPRNLYFCLDSLDGTKAFIRRASHGIGSMISLSAGKKVIAAYIGDVMTQEIYGFHDESPDVYRYSEDGDPEKLVVNEDRLLKDQDILLANPPDDCPVLVRAMARRFEHGGLFRKLQVGSGGIGISMALLWKGEIGGVTLGPCHDTPWDFNPMLGISQKMGFVFLRILRDDSILQVNLHSLSKITHRRYELLVIHKSRSEEFLQWYRSRSITT